MHTQETTVALQTNQVKCLNNKLFKMRVVILFGRDSEEMNKI